jgi:Ala-tRNA(Pro) deacylase
MGIALTLAQYLIDHEISYDVVTHPKTAASSDSADAAQVPRDRFAKAVVLKGADGYVIAVLPASRRIRLDEMRHVIGRDVDLATEEQIESLFSDCEPGAVPAVGAAYGLRVVVDESLSSEPDVYFEGGDHASLVHVTGENFRRLMAGAMNMHFSQNSGARPH